MKIRLFPVLFLFAVPVLADPVEEARSLIEARQYAEAEAILEQALSDPAREGESLTLLTKLCNVQGKFEEGIGYGKWAVALLPDSAEVHYQYALALRQKMENVNKLKAMFIIDDYKAELRRALELDPKHLDANEEQIGFLYNAPGFAGGDKEKAKEQLEGFKKIDVRRARLFEADILFDEGEVERAVAILSSLLETDPADPKARWQLAWHYQSDADYRKANEQFTWLLESDDPREIQSARYQLARSRVLGEFEQEAAIALLEEYIAAQPETLGGLPSPSNAYWRMGLAYRQLGRTEEARAALEQAVALDPSNKEAKKALKDLP